VCASVNSGTAAFVVGCDGAHSVVRHLLNLPFEGAAYDALFMLADIDTNDTSPADQLQLCPSELGPAAIFPMSASWRRVVATIDRANGETPTLEFVRQILRQRAPAALEARALRWSSYFHVHHRSPRWIACGRCSSVKRFMNQIGRSRTRADPSSPDGDAAAVTCRRGQPSSCMRPLVPG
jgi:2-polyprenyl-6-methoxyphenol hydroxylase-like FAD-dependent oxidoreductase